MLPKTHLLQHQPNKLTLPQQKKQALRCSERPPEKKKKHVEVSLIIFTHLKVMVLNSAKKGTWTSQTQQKTVTVPLCPGQEAHGAHSTSQPAATETHLWNRGFGC